jgi:hypothetical protein
MYYLFVGCGMAGEKNDRIFLWFLLVESTREKGTRSAIHLMSNCKLVLEQLG